MLAALLWSRLGAAMALLLLAWAVSAAGSIDPARSFIIWIRVAVYVALAGILWERLSTDARLLDYTLRVLTVSAVVAAAFAVFSLYLWAEPLHVLRGTAPPEAGAGNIDRKSTRLNSSH